MNAPDNPVVPVVPMAKMPLGELLAALAAKSPTPGGGAAAAHSGAIGVALAEMVVAYSVGRKSLAAHEPVLRAAAFTLADARAALLELAEEDARAYAALNALQRLPDADPARAGTASALAAATEVPMRTARACADALALMASLRGRTNPHLASDLRIAKLLAHAATRASAVNVEVNLPGLPEPQAAAARARLADVMAAADRSATEATE
jgi:formiminotetrahydrofolate cyclodeaminase